MIPVQLRKKKNIEEGWNQVVGAHARFNEDTEWNLISIRMAKDMSMDIMPIPASVGWNCPDWENKEGGKVKAVGLGVGSIMRL